MRGDIELRQSLDRAPHRIQVLCLRKWNLGLERVGDYAEFISCRSPVDELERALLCVVNARGSIGARSHSSCQINYQCVTTALTGPRRKHCVESRDGRTSADKAVNSSQNSGSMRTWRTLATGAGTSSKSMRLETSIVGRDRDRR